MQRFAVACLGLFDGRFANVAIGRGFTGKPDGPLDAGIPLPAVAGGTIVGTVVLNAALSRNPCSSFKG